MTEAVFVALRLDRRASFVLRTKPVCVVDAPIKSEHDGNEEPSPYDPIGGPPPCCVYKTGYHSTNVMLRLDRSIHLHLPVCTGRPSDQVGGRRCGIRDTLWPLAINPENQFRRKNQPRSCTEHTEFQSVCSSTLSITFPGPKLPAQSRIERRKAPPSLFPPCISVSSVVNTSPSFPKN